MITFTAVVELIRVLAELKLERLRALPPAEREAEAKRDTAIFEFLFGWMLRLAPKSEE